MKVKRTREFRFCLKLTDVLLYKLFSGLHGWLPCYVLNRSRTNRSDDRDHNDRKERIKDEHTSTRLLIETTQQNNPKKKTIQPFNRVGVFCIQTCTRGGGLVTAGNSRVVRGRIRKDDNNTETIKAPYTRLMLSG